MRRGQIPIIWPFGSTACYSEYVQTTWWNLMLCHLVSHAETTRRPRGRSSSERPAAAGVAVSETEYGMGGIRTLA